MCPISLPTEKTSFQWKLLFSSGQGQTLFTCVQDLSLYLFYFQLLFLPLQWQNYIKLSPPQKYPSNSLSYFPAQIYKMISSIAVFTAFVPIPSSGHQLLPPPPHCTKFYFAVCKGTDNATVTKPHACFLTLVLEPSVLQILSTCANVMKYSLPQHLCHYSLPGFLLFPCLFLNLLLRPISLILVLHSSLIGCSFPIFTLTLQSHCRDYVN